MSFVGTFEMPGLPKSPNALLGATWQARAGHKKLWKSKVLKAIQGVKLKEPLKRAELTCIRFSSIQPDHDGLVGSFKAVIDAFRDLGVIEDDNPQVIGQPEYRWEKVSPGKGKISVTIKEIPS